MHLLIPISILLGTARAVLVPGPWGPYDVAMKVLPLTDTSRPDPLDPTGKSKVRRLLVSVNLPIEKTEEPCPMQTIPYMTPPVAASYGEQATEVGFPDTLYKQFDIQFCNLDKLPACTQARQRRKTYPLVLFDPGFAESRLVYGAMARSLASQGYVVVTVDHPFDAAAVQFPDGSIIQGVNLNDSDINVLQKVLSVRIADVEFILNQFHNESITAPLLAKFPGTIDLRQIAIWGHSFGGVTSASIVHADPRVAGGLNLDGGLIDPIMSTDIRKPFVQAGRLGHPSEDSTWNTFWPHLKGKRAEIAIANTLHGAFKDMLMLITAVHVPPQVESAVQQVLGSIDAFQLDRDLNGILVAFFDLLFRGQTGPLRAIPHKFANVTIPRSSF